ncbi:MAG: rhodanese-like domain-containing protein, partial [Gemmatimonadota bacterium]
MRRKRIPLLLASLSVLAMPLQAQQARLLVSGDWLEENLSRSDLVVLHASTDGMDYQTGHIPGARMVLMDRISWAGPTGVGMELRGLSEIRDVLAEAGVSDRSTVVVYGTNPMIAARLWMTLDVVGAGASEPLFLDGGLQVWKEEGRPTSVEVPRVARGRLNLRPPENKIVNAEWILVRLGHDDLSLLDARPDDEFSGADNGLNGRLNPGHIPGARQLLWENLVESRERPVFHPAGELARLFTAAGADPTDTVVTYCQAGLRASVNYMIARMLEYNT